MKYKPVHRLYTKALLVFLMGCSLLIKAQTLKSLNLSTVESISSIVEENGSLWIGTNGGLIRWDMKEEKPHFFNRAEKGALMTSITCIAIDKKGNKWLGTSDMGIVKYDGTNIVVKNSYNDPNWAFNQIIAIRIDQKQNVWVAASGILTKIDTNMVYTSYPMPYTNQLYPYISDFVIDSNDVKWIGTRNGLYKFDGSYKLVESGNTLTVNDNISCLGIGRNGLMYVGIAPYTGSQGGLVTISGTTYTKFFDSAHEIRSMEIDSSGVAIICSSGRFFRFDGTSILDTYSTSDNPKAFHMDKKGRIWYGLFTASSYPYLTKLEGNNEYLYDLRNAGIHANNIRNIQIENGKDVWINSSAMTTKQGGLTAIGNKQIKVYDSFNTMDFGYEPSALLVDSDGNKWIGGTDGQMCKFDGSSFTPYAELRKTDIGSVKSLREDHKGNIIAIGFRMATYDGTPWVATEILPDRTSAFYSFDIDSKGVNWVTTSSGLYTLTNTVWQKDYDWPNEYSKIHIDKYDNKWLAYNSVGGLVRYGTGSSSIYKTSNSPLPHDVVTAVTSDKNGVVWLGCLGGYVVRFDGTTWKVYSPQNTGVPSAFINDLAVDDKNNVWVGTNYGLVVINEAGVDIDLEDFSNISTNMITSPKMGQKVNACAPLNITFIGKLADHAQIEFSPDNGLTWDPVDIAYTGNYSYSYWLPPYGFASDKCLLRAVTLSHHDTISMVGPFSINAQIPKYIHVTSPQDETTLTSTKHTIVWDSQRASSNLFLYYSTDNGFRWTFDSFVSNTGSYEWAIPSVLNGQNFYIKLEDETSKCIHDIVQLKYMPVVGVDDVSRDPLLSIYPNPSKGQFCVSHTAGGSTDLELFDVQGRSMAFHQTDNTQGVTISLSPDHKGVFYLKSQGIVTKLVVE